MIRFEVQYGRAAAAATGRMLPVPLFAVDDGDEQATPSFAAGDVTISKDNAAFGNIGTNPTVLSDTAMLVLSAADVTCRQAVIRLQDQGTIAWADEVVVVDTIDHPLAARPNGVNAYGIAQGGTSNTLVLNSEAPSDPSYNDAYKGVLVVKHGGPTAIGTLAISAVAEKFKTTTTFGFVKAGLVGTKAATDNLVFSANDTINTAAASGTFWGAWLVTYDGTSAFATQSPSADQVYASEAAALAAARALTPASGTVRVGYITAESLTDVDWVANTDDLTPASDCTSANLTDATLGLWEESFDVLTYVASTRTLTFAGASVRKIVTGVDEYWVVGSPDVPTTSDVSDTILVAAQGSPIHSNVQQINDVTIVGDGSGTPFNV
jgi:hypothetical protein